jgi:hypothetical protein
VLNWTITVWGGRDPSPLVSYQQQQLPATVGMADQDATWISIAGTAQLDTQVNVDYWPAYDPGAVDQPSPGAIQIITPLVLPPGWSSGSWPSGFFAVASVGLASYDIDANEDTGWAIAFNDVAIERNDQEGRAEIVVQAEYRGDWGLNRIGFKADLLIPQSQP